MTKRFLLGAAVLLFALAGCTGRVAGVVVDKTHADSYPYTTMTCFAYDAKGMCSNWVPITNYVPERWGLVVRDDEGQKHEVTVDEAEWKRIKEGEPWKSWD